MGSMANPYGSPTYNTNALPDCSQPICTAYCPQWCYILFPPPPQSSSGGAINFSLLIVALIGILTGAFLLIAYYTIISKYCKRTTPTTRSGDDPDSISAFQSDQNNQQQSGLDEATIKSIAVCKYRSGDGFIEGTECAVCLSEFERNENLRVLPKCSHAFHLPCIDTWLKSHPNCPLCRANVVSAANPVARMDRTGGNSPGSSSATDLILAMDERAVERNMNGGVETNGGIRRSVSFHGRFLVSDMLVMQDEEMGMGIQEQSSNNGGQPGNVIRRSVSTGRFMFS